MESWLLMLARSATLQSCVVWCFQCTATVTALSLVSHIALASIQPIESDYSSHSHSQCLDVDNPFYWCCECFTIFMEQSAFLAWVPLSSVCVCVCLLTSVAYSLYSSCIFSPFFSIHIALTLSPFPLLLSPLIPHYLISSSIYRIPLIDNTEI